MLCYVAAGPVRALDFAQRADYSEDTALRIDREVQRIVQIGYERATGILTEQRTVLDRLAHDLLERETLDGNEVYTTIRELTGLDVAPAGSGTPAPSDTTEDRPTAPATKAHEPKGEVAPSVPLT